MTQHEIRAKSLEIALSLLNSPKLVRLDSFASFINMIDDYMNTGKAKCPQKAPNTAD